MNTNISKLKRSFIAFASLLSAFLIAFLPFNFVVSAVTVSDNTKNTIVELPFPSPDSFGDCSRSLVIYDNSDKRYTMFVLTYVVSPSFTADSIYFKATLNTSSSDSTVFNKLSFSIGTKGDIYYTEEISDTSVVIASNFHLYRFNWSSGSSVYTVAERTITWTPDYNGNLVGVVSLSDDYIESITSGSASYTLPSGDYNGLVSYTVPYNGTIVDPAVHSSGTIGYSFTSTDSGAILSVVNKMNSTLNSVDDSLNNIENGVNSANSYLGSIDARLEEANTYIDLYGNGITFYLSKILEQLQDDSYTPEETTTNEALNNYNSAEGALMDDNINQLNNFEMPDLDSFNSGSQKNAFAFISNNIEFFSGMNGSGSVSKIATVLLVILGLGLASFIIGMTNRRKG
ncbi:MAG: hypothetical protein ACI4GY_07695 [Acutalibacteraceae bacterium]